MAAAAGPAERVRLAAVKVEGELGVSRSNCPLLAAREILPPAARVVPLTVRVEALLVERLKSPPEEEALRMRLPVCAMKTFPAPSVLADRVLAAVSILLALLPILPEPLINAIEPPVMVPLVSVDIAGGVGIE